MFLAFALAAWAALATQSFAQQDPIIGNWKLNVAKSKYSPGPAPKSSTLKIERVAPNGVKVVQETVGADGKATGTEYSAQYDGKDYPLKGSTVSNTVSLRKVNDRVVERTDKKDGKVTFTITREMAKDGKSFATTVKGTNSKGEPVNNTAVWERM